MKKFFKLHLLLVLSGILQHGTNISAQVNSKWSISAAINGIESQLGDPEWDSWGYAKNNFHNYGDIKNKSLSLSIIPKYSIRNDIFLRFEFGITDINLQNYYEHSPNSSSSVNPNVISDQKIDQNVYRFIPGIQWNFMKKKSIETYVGINASYLHYSDMKYQNHVETRNFSNNMLIGGYEDNAIATGGFATGIGALAGFNIYLGKHVSFGAECSFSFLYYNLGDTFSGESAELINPAAIQTYSFTTTSYKGLQFSKILPSLNISVWF